MSGPPAPSATPKTAAEELEETTVLESATSSQESSPHLATKRRNRNHLNLRLSNMARNYPSNYSKRKKPTSNQPEDNEVENEEDNTVDPLDSLRSKQEEVSCKDCLLSVMKQIYNFTIASCQYTFCDCFRSRKRSSYLSLEEIEHDGDSDDPIEQDVRNMKRRLKFHFMNPFQKWKYPNRRRFPWKLIVQLTMIVLVTTQLWVNATQKFSLNNFLKQNRATFKNLFIKDPTCDPDPSINYYDTAALATIFTYDQLWDQLNYTVHMYYNIKDVAAGPYGYQWSKNDTPPPLQMTITHYETGDFNPEERTYHFSDTIIHHKLHVNDTSVKDQLNDTVLNPANFSSVIKLSFDFNLSSVYLDQQSSPLCCQFGVKLLITNEIHTGNLPVTMDIDSTIEGCDDNATSFDPSSGLYDQTWITVLDVLVTVVALISIIQCTRSIIKSAHFSKDVRKFFQRYYDYRLKFSEYLPLYNAWFIGAIFSNVLIIIGTILYLITDYTQTHHIEVDDIVAIIYGFGVFCQWLGLLRFLSYFDKYNMLLITLRVALPSVLRFMFCGFILYVAFLLLGWLVLGPYHPKFRDMSVTSECLFSLINGDDMFNTYIQMSDASYPAFIFSKIYLYVFISLFIYVVLSVFISLISDTYETLHEQWANRSRGLLQDYANDRIGNNYNHTHEHTHEAPTRQRAESLSTVGDDHERENFTGSSYAPPYSASHRCPSPLGSFNAGSNLYPQLPPAGTPTLHRFTPTLAVPSPRVTMRGGINAGELESSTRHPGINVADFK